MILSARYANAGNTSAVIETDDLGAVALSVIDTPDAWAAMLAWGTPEAFILPPDPIPETISDRQFYQALALQNKITQAEALAAVKTGTIPPVLQNAISGMTGDSAFIAEMLLAGATQFNRSHQLTNSLGQALGYTPSDLDGFWTFASDL